MSDESKPHMICRGYDQQLIAGASSCLLYMLAESSMRQLVDDKHLAEFYKREPNRENHEALIKALRRIKSPLNPENRVNFSHGVFVVLQDIFEGVWRTVEFPEETKHLNREEVGQKAFSLWARSVGELIQDMAGGVHGKGADAEDEIMKKWEQKNSGNFTDLGGTA